MSASLEKIEFCHREKFDEFQALKIKTCILDGEPDSKALSTHLILDVKRI